MLEKSLTLRIHLITQITRILLLRVNKVLSCYQLFIFLPTVFFIFRTALSGPATSGYKFYLYRIIITAQYTDPQFYRKTCINNHYPMIIYFHQSSLIFGVNCLRHNAMRSSLKREREQSQGSAREAGCGLCSRPQGGRNK
jgi:hypothetical protein